MGEFEGQVALITGAGSGVGAAIALALSAAKAEIRLVGKTRDSLQDIAQRAQKFGGKAEYLVTDLGNECELSALTDRLARDLARLDILVQNAAVHIASPIAQASMADLDRHYRVNLRAPYALTRALLPLLEASQGQVVFVNSSSAIGAKPSTSQYDATKHALRAFADSLRGEVNAQGIRVLSLYLGRTASKLQRQIHKSENKPYYPERLLQPEDVASVVLNALSLSRTAEVTDIHIRPMIAPEGAAFI
ncbi:SDR family NAD(P)-dependent oxidoreductase [Dongia deserti]|uniref:SDR family NAD(P)-dependent oxidoreductase n=1 Tax=Dongia deserti TaxID=2268030 RepID=UPI000E65A9AF|nr:SDR family NAD(P)-dependent oxidoreductase [Dongia deserti]